MTRNIMIAMLAALAGSAFSAPATAQYSLEPAPSTRLVVKPAVSKATATPPAVYQQIGLAKGTRKPVKPVKPVVPPPSTKPGVRPIKKVIGR